MKRNLIKDISGIILVTIILIASFSCEQESFEPILDTGDGAGTLTNFKAYEINDVTGLPDSAYGRVVFWLGLDGNTLVQLSLYNVSEGDTYQTDLLAGAIAAPDTVIMDMYDITNTGETFTNTEGDDVNLEFGEFTTSKYFVIADPEFFNGLPSLNAHISIMDAASVIASGDIGMNAEPVEEN